MKMRVVRPYMEKVNKEEKEEKGPTGPVLLVQWVVRLGGLREREGKDRNGKGR